MYGMPTLAILILRLAAILLAIPVAIGIVVGITQIGKAIGL